MRTLLASDIHLLLDLFAERSRHATLIDLRGQVRKDVPWPMRPLTPGAQRVMVRTDHHWAAHSEVDLVIDIGEAPALEGYQRTLLHAVSDPDGRLRWLYQPGRLGSVLRFHNAVGWRGRIMHAALATAAALRMDRLVRSHTFTLHHRRPLRIDRLIADLPHEYRTIFMGTPGAQRKFNVLLGSGSKVTAFVKVATDGRTTALLNNERSALRSVAVRLANKAIVPSVYDMSDDRVLACSNIAGSDMHRSSDLTLAHAKAVLAISERGTIPAEEPTLDPLARISERCDRIGATDTRGARGRLLAQLRAALVNERMAGPMTTAPAHGDFTPWNIHCGRELLAIHDWEMYRTSAPALFDLVHFHMQQGIIVDRLDFLRIRERIERSCALPPIAEHMRKHALDMDRCIRWYLMEAVSYFLEVYAAQTSLTSTQQRQLFAWEEAMAHMFTGFKAAEDQRSELLYDINDMLRMAPHAYLKFRWNDLGALPLSSDLDLAVDRATSRKVIRLSAMHPFVQCQRVHRRSFMTSVELHLRDGGYLAIDLIHRFQRKEVTMLPIEEVLAEARPNENGLMVPAFEHDLSYLFLFHLLNGARVPEKYRVRCDLRPYDEWNRALRHVKQWSGMAFTDRETFWNADPAVCRTALLRTLRGRMRIGQLAIRALQYAWDTFRSLFSERGFVVTFSGVDGAGKSTVIAHVKEELERTFRREVVLMRHRPGLLPMLNAWRVGRANAERMATIAPPRKGGNTSVMGSILRFAYYYVDYLVGQWYVHLRHVMRGRVVLYDRYYFDFMADPRRSNLHLDPRPLRVLYRFVHKPRLNFFLYADSGTILQRKRELDKAEVELLTDRYLRLFQGLGHRGVRGRYITLRNDDLQRTLRGIRAEYARVA